VHCVGVSLPAGWSVYGYDIDDLDPSQQQDDSEEQRIILFD
jgi:hypothetical protein